MGFHLPELIILLVVFCWLAALIHCIINKWLRAGEKVAWILFFFFCNWIAALCYLIYWFGFGKQTRTRVVVPVQSSYVPGQQQDISPEQNYSPYGQGYQPIRAQLPPSGSSFIVEREEPEQTMSHLYEQSQVMYPEDPA